MIFVVSNQYFILLDYERFMPEPITGLIRLTLRQDFATKTLENVFYYWNSGDIPPISLTNLGEDFDIKVLPLIAAIQTTALDYVEIVVNDVLGLSPDVIVVPTTLSGTLLGEQVTSFTSMGFKYNPLTKETRKGAKRFAGQTEDVVSGNAITAAYRAQCDLLADVLDNSISDGVTSYGPVVFGLPNANRLTNIVNPVNNVTVDAFLTTQSSRKRRL